MYDRHACKVVQYCIIHKTIDLVHCLFEAHTSNVTLIHTRPGLFRRKVPCLPGLPASAYNPLNTIKIGRKTKRACKYGNPLFGELNDFPLNCSTLGCLYGNEVAYFEIAGIFQVFLDELFRLLALYVFCETVELPLNLLQRVPAVNNGAS